ncbi:MAG: endopeptidase La [Lentisphaerae bacterium GWF2_44_16]|nr:MAG: endopeptidase La [Lentisphaerae bacterium GWF2_44_16]
MKDDKILEKNTVNVPETDVQDANIQKVPVLTLSGMLVFPYTLSPLVIEGEETVNMIEKTLAGERLIGVFPEVPPEAENPENMMGAKVESEDFDGKKISRIGVVARIVKMLRFPDGTVRVLVRGLKRIKFISKAQDEKMNFAIVEKVIERKDNEIETVAMARNALNQFQEIITYSPNFPEELKIAILNVSDNIRIVDMIADTINISFAEKLSILSLPTLHERLQLLTILLNREVEVLHLGSEIQSQVHNALSKSQREFFLREQLKTIKRELGDESKNPDLVSIEARLAKITLPENVMQIVRKEMERLEMIPQASGEYNVAYTYIDWLISVPWSKYSDDRIDVKEASKILNDDHYDLKDVKERILEFLAVLQLKKDKKSPIICFVGPPGVGKTSLGQSIAKSMGRQFVRMSLGGIKDEAEIRGHRRTYIGALPGRIIQGIKKAGTSNPVFMLDEIDKVGNDFRGDPASALLEVLDPKQNAAFNDHYLELDYDLSAVMFIATANILDTIPAPLLDRMEIIRIPGYTAMEKKEIARRFLIPRQILENGLSSKLVSFKVDAVDELINYYTREAGVRNLERTAASVCRKIARKIVDGKISVNDAVKVSAKDIHAYLGPRKFLMDEAGKKPEIGVATGMAWTSSGGSILSVEATMMPGKGDLKLTGSLGDVMKESAHAAFSFLKSRSAKLKINNEIFSKNDFHIHVPDGATPKDGPSAGITIATALVSMIKERPLKMNTAMTGEITLRGKVTPVGGIKEKVIAALRSGIKTVIMPAENEKDLENIPDEVRKKIKFKFVKEVDEVFKFMLNLK